MTFITNATSNDITDPMEKAIEKYSVSSKCSFNTKTF